MKWPENLLYCSVRYLKVEVNPYESFGAAMTEIEIESTYQNPGKLIRQKQGLQSLGTWTCSMKIFMQHKF